MSKETKKETTETTENKDNKKFSARELVWVLIGLIIGILIGWGIFTATLSSSINKLNDTEIVQTIDNAVSVDSTESVSK